MEMEEFFLQKNWIYIHLVMYLLSKFFFIARYHLSTLYNKYFWSLAKQKRMVVQVYLLIFS